MNVLILGSGGREHALAWKISQSSLLKSLYLAPGNPGTEKLGTNVNLSIKDFGLLKEFVDSNQIDMIVVGPEEPLVLGVYDFFKNELPGVKVVGPSASGARLEGSKDFAKEFMMRHQIPTAQYQTFKRDTLYQGFEFLESLQPPYVLKADGLAGGKGVFITHDIDEAKRELSLMLGKQKFGNASAKVVIEEFMKGIECSVFVITNGKEYKILPNAKDYKRIGEGDIGLNTGGMGAVSPVPFVDDVFMEKVENRIIIPTIKGLESEGMEYFGFVYFGLMNCDGEPKVVEYNARLGDPETEVIVPRIKSDLLEIFAHLFDGSLSSYSLELDPRAASTVVVVSEGYPVNYETGKNISGLDDVTDSIVFHAGTKRDGSRILNHGGRVLAVTSYGSNLKEALEKCYHSIDKIYFDGMYYRRDIGFDVETEK